MRVEAKTNVHFSHLKLDIYGAKEAKGGYSSDLIGSLTLMSDVWLASGVVGTEDLKFAISKDLNPERSTRWFRLLEVKTGELNTKTNLIYVFVVTTDVAT